jgi:hypothetical protein
METTAMVAQESQHIKKKESGTRLCRLVGQKTKKCTGEVKWMQKMSY